MADSWYRQVWDDKRKRAADLRRDGRALICVNQSRVQVICPYSDEFVVEAHKLGGRWRHRSQIWSFPLNSRWRVAQILVRLWGESNVEGVCQVSLDCRDILVEPWQGQPSVRRELSPSDRLSGKRRDENSSVGPSVKSVPQLLQALAIKIQLGRPRNAANTGVEIDCGGRPMRSGHQRGHRWTPPRKSRPAGKRQLNDEMTNQVCEYVELIPGKPRRRNQ